MNASLVMVEVIELLLGCVLIEASYASLLPCVDAGNPFSRNFLVLVPEVISKV